ncbi:MAG: ABC transporter ATP-binding protein [Alcaligenaceae bacterium]|nr:ABC transporter ATP-binding protein [Alcaligenaceae bacterium]
MSTPLLHISELTKRFGGYTAVSNISLDIQRGERIGLIGPNGSGKTTLMNCVSGTLPPTAGAIAFESRDITHRPPHKRARLGLSRTFQIPRPFHSMTVLDNLMIPLEYVAHRGVFNDQHAVAEAMALLDEMGLADRAHERPATLSQVDLRKLELARALAAHPKLLICDESMAGLSAVEVDEMLNILMRINGQNIAIIMIEHIMQAVMQFSQRLFCLDAGELVCEGSPQEVVANPHVQRAYLGT